MTETGTLINWAANGKDPDRNDGIRAFLAEQRRERREAFALYAAANPRRWTLRWRPGATSPSGEHEPGYWALVHPLGQGRLARISGAADDPPTDEQVFDALHAYFTANPDPLERELFGLIPGAPTARAVAEQAGWASITGSNAADVDFAEAARACHLHGLTRWAHDHATPPFPVPGNWDLLVQLILDHPDSGLAYTDADWWMAHGGGDGWWRKILHLNKDAWGAATGIDFQRVA